MQEIDQQMKQKTDFYTNKISNECMSDGLHKMFPDNNLQLMVLSGAKGSMVNISGNGHLNNPGCNIKA